MRNLVCVTQRVRHLHTHTNTHTQDGLASSGRVVAVAQSFSSSSASSVCALVEGGRLACYSYDLELCLCVYELSSANTHTWKWLACFPDTESIACFSAEGAIVELVHAEVRQVGAIEAGICAVAQAPDQERVAIVTANSTLMLMSSRWEPIDEVPLPHLDASSGVGLAWRYDGAYLALLSRDMVDGIYRLRVFDVANGIELHSVGRNEDDSPVMDLDGACGALTWCSNGSIIGCFQRTRRKAQIAFFERNGLRHRELVLNVGLSPDELAKLDVVCLSWNVESDLLAMVLKVDEESVVQVYYRENYHWYLKQQWCYGDEHCVSFLAFDPEKPYRLCQAYSNKVEREVYVSMTDMTWDHCVSMSHEGTAVVIDGSALNFTELGKAMIPPPMCAGSIIVSSACNHVSFLSTSRSFEARSWLLACLCSGGEVLILDASITASTTKPGTYAPPVTCCSFKINDLAIDNLLFPWLVRQIALFTDPDGISLRIALLYTTHVLEGEFEDILAVVKLSPKTDTNDGRAFCIADSWKQHLRSQVLRVVPDVTGSMSCLYLSAMNGPVMRFADNQNLLEEFMRFPESCNRILVIPRNLCTGRRTANVSANEEESQVVLLGISERNRLYAAEHLVSIGVNSFGLNTSFSMLLYVTIGTQPHIHFVQLSTLAEADSFLSEDSLAFEIEAPRPVERGARLLSAINGSSSVCLQMPRGNLEGFTPRPLLLRQAERLIELERFGEALVLLRKHRIDLNFLCDHAPCVFVNGLHKFILQTPSSDMLNLFISSLQDENCSGITPGHAESIRTRSPMDLWDVSTGRGKVNAVCQALREHMQQIASENPAQERALLLPILTTFAKQQPPLLEAALSFVLEDARKHDVALVSPQVQGSLKYLAFLVTSDQLFNAALGMYNFTLTRAVARQTQQDPKQYLPLLSDFEAIEDELERKFRVNVHLNRIEQAITLLAELLPRLSPERAVTLGETYVQLSNEHGMEEVALAHLPRKLMGLRNQILNLLGERLMKESKAADALYAFMACNPIRFERAIQAARSANEWRLALSLAQRSGVVQLESFAFELANELQEDKPHGALAASQILVEYCHDVEGAVTKLCSASLWDEAVRVCHAQKRADLLDSDVEPSIEDNAQSFLQDLAARRHNFIESIGQLAELWRQRCEMMGELVAQFGDQYGNGKDATEAPMDDTASQYSGVTTASNMSHVSQVSTRSNASSRSVASASTSFSVEGVRHTTLVGRDSSAPSRSQKRRDRKQSGKDSNVETFKPKGPRASRGGRVSWTKEFHLCKSILESMDVSTITDCAKQLVKGLLFFGQPSVAGKVQRTMDELVATLEGTHIPQPPSYPAALLRGPACDLHTLLPLLHTLHLASAAAHTPVHTTPVGKDEETSVVKDPRPSWELWRASASLRVS